MMLQFCIGMLVGAIATIVIVRICAYKADHILDKHPDLTRNIFFDVAEHRWKAYCKRREGEHCIGCDVKDWNRTENDFLEGAEACWQKYNKRRQQ